MAAEEELLTQIEARELAKYLNSDGKLARAGLAAIAQTVPAQAWGGHERGWTVAYVPLKR